MVVVSWQSWVSRLNLAVGADPVGLSAICRLAGRDWRFFFLWHRSFHDSARLAAGREPDMMKQINRSRDIARSLDWFSGFGRLPKWPTGADCKSAGSRLLWFESRTYHHFYQRGNAGFPKVATACRHNLKIHFSARISRPYDNLHFPGHVATTQDLSIQLTHWCGLL